MVRLHLVTAVTNWVTILYAALYFGAKDLQKILTYAPTTRIKVGGRQDVLVLKIYMKTFCNENYKRNLILRYQWI
jgi:hypothetical protein